MKSVFLLVTILVASPVWAEEFLGIEQSAESTADDTATEAPEPAPTSSAPAGTWGGSGGLWGGTHQFRAALTVSYYFNRFVGLETHGYYQQFQYGDDEGKMYGPEIDLMLRGTNPTMITPFVGAGMGFDRWARSHNKQLFDDASSVTATALGGVNIAMTRHFGLQGVRKQKVYLADPPKSFKDRTTREQHSRITNYIGFVVMF